jgi:hypothetical protein
VSDFLAEAEAFPQGRHDVQVDAVSGAVAMLATTGPPPAEASADRPPGGWGGDGLSGWMQQRGQQRTMDLVRFRTRMTRWE